METANYRAHVAFDCLASRFHQRPHIHIHYLFIRFTFAIVHWSRTLYETQKLASLDVKVVFFSSINITTIKLKKVFKAIATLEPFLARYVTSNSLSAAYI